MQFRLVPAPVLALALVFSLLAVSGRAQDRPVIPAVDLGSAQVLVDTLTRENETLTSDADRLRKDATTLMGQITAARKESSDLLPLLDEVKARNADIATLAEALVDRGLKGQATAAFAKNKATEKRIKKRLEDLSAQVLDLTKQIEAKTTQAEINDARIARNNDHIFLLQATLTKTRLQESQLRFLVDQIDGLSAKVDAALPSDAIR